MYKQIIIVRKDLALSHGKMSSQVAHGAMAFLTGMIRKNTIKTIDNRFAACTLTGNPQFYKREDLNQFAKNARDCGKEYFYAKPVDPKKPFGKMELCRPDYHYEANIYINKDLYEQWICGEFTKCVLQAKNKNHLLKAKTMAEDIGMLEGEDFFCIYDNCHTELEPEEESGTTLTCIGFRPMDAEVIDQIGKKYHLYV